MDPKIPLRNIVQEIDRFLNDPSLSRTYALKKVRAMLMENIEGSGPHWKRRQARRRSLYNRDKGICQICFKPVPFNEFTVDHYPIKKRDGGPDSLANTRVAHRNCNEELEYEIE